MYHTTRPTYYPIVLVDIFMNIHNLFPSFLYLSTRLVPCTCHVFIPLGLLNVSMVATAAEFLGSTRLCRFITHHQWPVTTLFKNSAPPFVSLTRLLDRVVSTPSLAAQNKFFRHPPQGQILTLNWISAFYTSSTSSRTVLPLFNLCDAHGSFTESFLFTHGYIKLLQNIMQHHLTSYYVIF